MTMHSFCHHCYHITVIVLALVKITGFEALYLAENKVEKWLG